MSPQKIKHRCLSSENLCMLSFICAGVVAGEPPAYVQAVSIIRFLRAIDFSWNSGRFLGADKIH